MKIIGFLLAYLSLPFAAANEPQYRESVEVRLHNLDAVVTDREGNPVSGLTRDDFVLLENGVPQVITNFSVYESGADRLELPEAQGVDTAEEAAAERKAPPRRLVFFIDEMSIQKSAREKLKKNALELVRTMRPDDVAAVLRPTATARIAQDYTSDRAAVEKALARAIDDCRIRITAPAFRELQALRRALANAESGMEVNAAKRAYVDAARGRVELRLAQIRALITSMAGGEGKKTLVIVTSGLSAHPGREAYLLDEQIGLREMPNPKSPAEEEMEMAERDEGLVEDPDGPGGLPALKPINALKLDYKQAQGRPVWEGMERIGAPDFLSQIDALARSAAARGVTIYALEPEVPLLVDTPRGADSSTDGTTLLANHVRGTAVIPPEMLSQLLHHGGQTLASLTGRTGGKWFRGIASIDETFRQVSSDLSVYYSLAYSARPSNGKPRKVELIVRDRPDLIVRTRTEVIDDEAPDLAGRLLAGLVYPRDVDDLKMTVTTERPRKRGRGWELPVEIVIPAERIAFVRADDGSYQGLVSVQYATSKDDTEFVGYGRRQQAIALTERQFAELGRIRYRYASTIPVPKGKIRIALGVVDDRSKQSSLQTLSVEAVGSRQ